MLALNDLPELVIDNIASLCLDSDLHISRRTCASLCLVSRCFVHIAQKLLYRVVSLEYSRSRTACASFARTVSGNGELAKLVRSFKISTALGGAVSEEESRRLACLLKEILASCDQMEDIRFTPDEDARNHERLYLEAWSSCHSLCSFTLVISRFRELVLLPDRPLQSLTIELSRDGDLQWDYDIFLASWPSRCLKTVELRLVNLGFPAYSDQVMLEKLRQMCRAIDPPKRLHLIGCTLSRKSLNTLLDWVKGELEELYTHLFKIVDGRDRPIYEYILPDLPHLKCLDSQWTIAKIHRNEGG